MTEPVASEPRLTNPITVVGDRSVRVTPAVAASLPEERLTAEVVCATGNRYEATWAGVGIGSLCDTVDAPAETTHVVVGSSDGYRMAVPILDALRGVIAFEKDGRPIDEQAPYSNRFVAPAVDGARDVKGVSRIEFHALEPDADPERLEQIEPDDDRFETVRATDSPEPQTQ
ncbi:MAG: molybdopterin-dependent oxidoreductase [Halobacteriota archaeon]